MNKRGLALGLTLMDIAAYFLFFIFLVFFIFVFKGCTIEGYSASITSSSLDLTAQLSTQTYLKSQVSIYDQETDMAHAMVWAKHKNDPKTLERVVRAHAYETRMFSRVMLDPTFKFEFLTHQDRFQRGLISPPTTQIVRIPHYNPDNLPQDVFILEVEEIPI